MKSLTVEELMKALQKITNLNHKYLKHKILVTTNDKSIGGRAYVKIKGIHPGQDWEKGQVRIEVSEPIVKKYNDRDKEKEKWLFTEKYSNKKYAVCSVCHYKVAKKDKYCRHCGQRLNNELIDKNYIC